MDNLPITGTDFADMNPEAIAFQITNARAMASALTATPYRWPETCDIPPRPWIMEDWLLQGEVTAIIAPAGTGKSTFTNALAISLSTGEPLLGKALPQGKQGAWIFNLEDGPDELDRQMAATVRSHGIKKSQCDDRLFLDSGLVQPLCMAQQNVSEAIINEDAFKQLEEALIERGISLLIVDPLVSSHQLSENSNEAVNLLVKRWKQLASDASCSVVLVHHTGKRNNARTGAEDGRGASALHAAVRVVLTLNKLSEDEAVRFNLDDNERGQIVVVENGKANRGPSGLKTYFKIEGFDLKNGNEWSDGDSVGVAKQWHPQEMAGLDPDAVRAVQAIVSAGEFAENHQSKKWVGIAIGEGFNLAPDTHKKQIQRLQKEMMRQGYLAVERRLEGGREKPFAIVGTASPITRKEMSHNLSNGGDIGAVSAGVAP